MIGLRAQLLKERTECVKHNKTISISFVYATTPMTDFIWLWFNEYTLVKYINIDNVGHFALGNSHWSFECLPKLESICASILPLLYTNPMMHEALVGTTTDTFNKIADIKPYMQVCPKFPYSDHICF